MHSTSLANDQADLLSSLVLSSCSALTNNAQSSGRITFVASLLAFVAARLGGLGAVGPLHTCCEARQLNDTLVRLDSVFVFMDPDRIALLSYCPNCPTGLHMSSPRQGGGETMGLLFQAYTNSWTPPCGLSWLSSAGLFL